MGMIFRRLGAPLTTGVGGVLFAGGVALIYVPAGLIVAGIGLLALGLIPDWGG